MIFLGDIHGEFNLLISMIKKFDFQNLNLIQVGDFGVGFTSLEEDKEMFSKLNDELTVRNVVLHAIRGNHDNPCFFSEEIFSFSNIIFVKDYSIINIEGKNILFVGGAISIDRNQRIQNNFGWWKDEVFNLDKKKLDELDLSSIEIIVSHTAPNFAYPISFSSIVYKFAKHDPKLLEELRKEREMVNDFFSYLKEKSNCLTHFYYGHFHDSNHETIEDVNFKLLNVFEMYEHK